MLTRATLPRRLDRSGVTAGVEQNGTQTEGGVYHPVYHRVYHPPPVVEVAPVLMYPCWKALLPARGQGDQTHRAAR